MRNNNKVAEEFGEYLRDLRKERNLTLLDLEKTTGYSNSYLSQIENGHKGVPGENTIKNIAKGLSIHPSPLLEKAGHSTVKNEYGEILEAAIDSKVSTSSERAVNIMVPYVEKIKLKNGKTKLRKLTDAEIQERLFDLDYFLNMNRNLYYKNKLLTKQDREKIISIIKIVME